MSAAAAFAPIRRPPQWILDASLNVDVRGCIASEILPNLWLGRAEFVTKLVVGESNQGGITHVLTVANDTPDVRRSVEDYNDARTSDKSPLAYKCVEIRDFGTDPGISRKFDEGFAFIKEGLDSGGVVFVHCANGSNRSPTFVIAFLMSHLKIGLEDALLFVVQRRPHIQPLKDNLRELVRWEKRTLAGDNSGSAQSESDETGLHIVDRSFTKAKKKSLKQFRRSLLLEKEDIRDGADFVGFMEEAISEAAAAVEAGNHPFGAVLVKGSEIILRAQNAVVVERDATRHAELVLVSKACKTFSREELNQTTLVTSTAPCPMCAGAIYWAGIGKVVYGCPAEVLGQISGEELAVDCKHVFESGQLHKVEVFGPVMGETAAQQHREFWPKFVAEGHSVV